MDVAGTLSLQSRPLVGFEKGGRKSDGFLRASCKFQPLDLQKTRSRTASVRCRGVAFEISCSIKKSAAPALESDNSSASANEVLTLKKKSQEVSPYLNGQCIFLVGMMGSGKTTVGRILSEVLGYSFFDCDKLIEEAVGATSVVQIFKEHGEDFFRENETKVLKDLSSMPRLVIATGGGAVIRPINWRHMQHGITVWLDVPIEDLAKRIAAVGTGSRPLLHQESGDPYKEALKRLTELWKERGEAYTNADARVSLKYIASKQGKVDDVCAVTPTAIAIEAIIQIKNFLKDTQREMSLDPERL